jgi:hypothetical protein
LFDENLIFGLVWLNHDILEVFRDLLNLGKYDDEVLEFDVI